MVILQMQFASAVFSLDLTPVLFSLHHYICLSISGL